ncbi:MAG: serine--tRNA ligase [archaeon]
MLDIRLFREHPEQMRDTLNRRKDTEKLLVVDELIELDKSWRELGKKLDELRNKRNTLSEGINKAKKEGKDAKQLIAEVKELPELIKKGEEALAHVEQEIQKKLSIMPNIMHEAVVYGKDAGDNPVIKTWGEQKTFSFPVKNHVELAEQLGLADFDASARISGNGFYFLQGDLALLNQALIRFAIEFMQKKGYTYVETPLLIKRFVLEAAMDVNAIQNSIYEVKGDDGLCMIGTSEHSMLGRFAGITFNEEELPKKLFSYSMCFRQEIGSHGINEKGLWRTHQFNKVEQFVFCLPEDSWKYYDELLQNSEEILQALKLPYRVIDICTGDLAIWKARSADVEVWRPTTKEYGEVMSLSNCTDYQARDLNTRVARKDGTKQVVHTLNNTALATSRILVAILENYQNEDGSIRIPDVLQPLMFGKNFLK